ncbi:MAG: S8 family serine peptidase [Microcoleus sp.]
MTELNIGALTDSTSYTGSIGTTNIYDLYKFNITSPGSFKFAIDNLSGNADIFLLNNSGATIYSSTNPGNAAETINADSLIAGEYTLKVLQVTGDIKYTLNLAPTETQTTSAADTLTGAKSDSSLTSNNATTLEKTTDNKDVITGDAVGDKTVTAEAKTATTEKPVSSTSEITAKSEPEKTVTATASATSANTDKVVSSTSETNITSAEKTVTATASATSATTDKSVSSSSETSIKSPEKTVTETVTATETTTEKPVTSNSETSITSEEKTVTETSTTTATTTEKPVTSNSAIAKAPTTSETTEKPVTTSAETTIETEPEKPAIAGQTVASKDPKTSETVAAVPDASKPEEKSNTATNNGEDKKTENANTAVPTAETTEKIEPPTNKELTAANPFTSGVFVVDSTGKVSIDYLLDGGLYRGQLAIISLKGMDKFVPGSPEFFKEAASRAMSNSEKGHIVIDDLSEGARFSGNVPEGNFNEGAYLGVKTFSMTPGDEFGIMMVPNDTVKFLYDYPSFGGDKRPLFSMATANPHEGFHLGQIADVTGEGNTFTMEDLRFDLGTDKDYNDIVFQIRGAKGKAALMDIVVNPDKDWRQTDLGKAVIAYAKPYITPEPETKPNLKGEISDAIDELEKQILTPSTSEKETPKIPAPAAATDKNTTDETKVAATDKVEEKPATTTVTAEEKVKDTANNSVDATKVETAEKVDTKPTDATNTSTAGKDTEVDSTEKLPVEKTPVPPAATEVEDKVTEVPAAETLTDKSNVETQVTATEKAETKPEVVPAESPAKEESKPAVVTEVKDKVNETPAAETFPDKSTVKTEVGATTPTQKVETKPEVLPAKTPTQQETMPVVNTNSGAESQNKETVTETETAGVDDAAPKESLPVSTNVEKSTDDNSTAAVNETVKEEVAQNKNVVNDDWFARLESIKQRLIDLSGADAVEENAIDRTSVARLETLTQKLQEQARSTPISDNTVALISRLEDMVVQVAPKPVETVQFEFPKVAQPLVGIFNENGFSQNNPKIDYSQITLAKDRVENDANPLVSVDTGTNPDFTALGIIEQINKNAPLVVGRAPASSEEWAKSLIEYVDTAKASGQPNAIVSLNFNLTEVNKDGSITPRYELTQAERDALAYAQKHNVLVVIPAGEEPETMSALGDISLEFDNIMTVGAAKRVNDSIAASKAYDLANTSGSGYALDILADGGSGETFNTSVAANKVAGAASQVWAANPKLSYRQVVDIIQRTATDLKTPNWDFETGSGLLNIPAAVNLAKVTPAIDTDVPIVWLDVDKKNQPLIGIIDTGFNGKNPDIDYKRIILGRDRVDNDNDPLLGAEGSEHGTHVLGIIGATQGNGIGIDGMNDDASIWLGRAIGSGKWAESLREFVDAAKASGQPKAVVNLSFDLTQTNPDGSVTTRYELTPQERQAIEYARQNGVMIVVAAGNNGGTMSALGQASQEFDNIITVGSINYNGDRADYSSFGYGLDFVARGGTPNEQILSTVGEGVNLKQMIGDEEAPEDEMSANARTTFEEVFGAFSDGKESENDEQELESLTPEERQVYDEATKEIDQLLKDYLGAASEKIALEYVDGYYGASVDALSKFVDAFDGDLADNLIKAQEILEEAGFKTDTPTETNLDFSIPLDLGIGEMAGTSVAAAKVTGAVSQVWAANPGLSYFQVKEILKQTAVDLNKPGWDLETGSGLVNIAAAVELAKRVKPQAYQPQPIQSPLTWSGEGKVTPGEREVAVSVPSFTGRLMNAGYVTQTGWLRIRSGPGTRFTEVGLKYPGDAIDFDAYEDNGGWVPDPSMPGGGSSRWYKIAGTNNWMSALYIDNTPERAQQERQQQDAIRRAEEDARRAEDEVRRAEDEARRAEDELRRLEAEQRRAEEEARRRAEEEARRRIEEELRRILEEQRRRQEQLQAAISEVAPKVGDLGALLGSYISNGVAVYQFPKGSLLIQPDGKPAFYEQLFDPTNEKTPVGYLADKFLHPDLMKRSLEQTAFLLGLGNSQQFLSTVGQKLAYEAVSPGNKGFVLPRFGNFSKNIDDGLSAFKNISDKWDDVLAYGTVKSPGKTGFILPDLKQPRFSAQVAKLGINPTKFGNIYAKAAKGAGVFGAALGLAPLAYEFFTASDPTKQREVAVKGAFDTLGTLAGGALFSFIPIPGATIVGGFVGGYLGSLAGSWVNDNWDTTVKPLTKPLEDGFNAISSFTTNAFEAAKAKAKAELEKAKVAATAAKVAYQNATATVQQVKVAYQTFKQEVTKQTTQIVQQSQQKLKEAAQKVVNNVVNKVAQNPVVQQVSKVAKQVANYAQKAVKTVGNIINGAKQFVNNVIDTGKQIVNNVIDTGKKAYQEVKNFVANTYETGKKVVTETYNKAAQAVNTVTNTISNGFNAAKSLFRW